jgi:hypothetical protein
MNNMFILSHAPYLNDYHITSESVYHFFDKIVCINLISRQDRLKYVKNIFKKLNIPVDFFITKKHKLGGKFGCFYSKYSVVKESYNSGANTLLMFEDDVKPTRKYDVKKINECIDFMKINKDWCIFYLGRGFPLSSNMIKDYLFRNNNNNIYQGFFGYNHSLVFSRRGMKLYLDKCEEIFNDKKKINNFINSNIYSDIIIGKLFSKTSYYHHYTLFCQNQQFDTDNNYGSWLNNDKKTANYIINNLRRIFNEESIFLSLDNLHNYLVMIVFIIIFIIIYNNKYIYIKKKIY